MTFDGLQRGEEVEGTPHIVLIVSKRDGGGFSDSLLEVDIRYYANGKKHLQS